MPYETTITLKVLHMDPIPDDMDLAEIANATISPRAAGPLHRGDYSGDYEITTDLIDDETCKAKLLEQRNSIEFFYPEG